MSEQIEMDEDDRGSGVANSNSSGEKKRFEVKKVISNLIFWIFN